MKTTPRPQVQQRIEQPEPLEPEIIEAEGVLVYEDSSSLAVVDPDSRALDRVHQLERARKVTDGALAPRTQQRYAEEWTRFTSWCASQGRHPLPATPETVLVYLTALGSPEPGNAPRAHGSLKPMHCSTIAIASSAIRYEHEKKNLLSPTLAPAVRRGQQGLRRQLGVAPKRRVDAATSDIIQKLLAHLRPGRIGIRDRALLTLGFGGALRRSEVVAIDLEHLRETPQGLALTIPRSKTDQEGEGCLLAIPRGEFPESCPVRSVQAWLAELASLGMTSGPLFRCIDRHGNVRAQGSSPDGRLSAEAVALIVQSHAKAAGLDPKHFAGHSLRSGFVTSAVRNDKTLASIQAQTRHKSMDTLMIYVREEEIWRNPPGKGIGL